MYIVTLYGFIFENIKKHKRNNEIFKNLVIFRFFTNLLRNIKML